MKAAFIERHGGPEELRFGDLPDPVAKPGEIIVDIHAASVNAADWKVRTGESAFVEARFPHVPGRDFSGVVSALSEGVEDFRIGDAVFAVCAVGQEGAYAEKIAINAEIAARKAAGLGHVEAAALALTGLTRSSRSRTPLSVGPARQSSFGVAPAAWPASPSSSLSTSVARVISTASAANHTYVRGRGANEVNKTSQRLCRDAMPRWTRLAAMWRSAPSQC